MKGTQRQRWKPFPTDPREITEAATFMSHSRLVAGPSDYLLITGFLLGRGQGSRDSPLLLSASVPATRGHHTSQEPFEHCPQEVPLGDGTNALKGSG